jgi:16S rRNA (uracil1498-N3)-methyltransferase
MQIVLLDNQGHERLVEVISTDRRDTTARVVKVRSALAEPAVAVTLYQCMLKSDKLEWVWQKATELGVTTLVPVVSNRTVARPGRAIQGKQERWATIVREAAEQSGRGRLPTVAASCSFTELLENATGTRLLPWEGGHDNPGLIHALTHADQPLKEVSILIGPEGGLENGEVEQAKEAGWQVVTMGRRILRAETAALAALAVVTSALGGLGDEALIKAPATPKTRAKKTSSKATTKAQDEPAKRTGRKAQPKEQPEASSVGDPTAAEV